MVRRDALGLGLRAVHYPALWARETAGVDFFEIIAENYLSGCAPARRNLHRARELAPIVLHGVSLNLLGPGDPDPAHLRALKQLADEVGAPWVTDHLCWTATHGHSSHDLLPAPRTRALARLAAARVREIQDRLERPFGLENLAPMATFGAADTLEEWEFFRDVVEDGGCGYLVDVNNLVVSSLNTGAEPGATLRGLDGSRVLQLHLAGHRREGRGPVVDTHDAPVTDDVWAVYRAAWSLLGPAPTLLEWDDRIPPYDEARAELTRAAQERSEARPTPAWPKAPRTRPVEAEREPVGGWQQKFLGLLAEPLVWRPPRAAPDTSRYDAGLVGAIGGEHGLGAVERLRAYHEQYWFRLLATLQRLYPALSRRMGLWSFNELASAFLTAHLPSGRDLGALGAGLPEFLAGSRWDTPDRREAALVDQVYAELFDLPVVSTWTPTASEQATLAQRRLVPSPTLRRTTLRWPMPVFRDQALEAAGEEALPLPTEAPATWLVFRTPSLDLVRLVAEPALVTLLEALEHEPVGAAMGRVAASAGDQDGLEAKVRGWFRAGVQWGWWIGVA